MSQLKLRPGLGLMLFATAMLLAPSRSWSSGGIFHLKQHVDNPGQTPMRAVLACSITCADGSGAALPLGTAGQCAAACASTCGAPCSQL